MPLFEPVLEALNARDVRYVVVGGVAVVLHGHARLTADLDLAVDLSPGQASKAIDALMDLADPMLSVDLFVDNPVDFGELWARSEAVTLARTTIRIAAIPDLIRLKRLANRPQDALDIEALEAIMEARDE